ncbi:histone H3.v1-like isoform X2 [Sparus aurata]|uniref:histone H3.v1-like isoform X2 n=1 Tax=Sparus aurata TaxID=8175 RepID=UPI0011C0E65F|nr:histone H3.v1-like isoform X2 [Sparus aurata]
MDLQQKNRPRLEPIQEESEQEDDVKRSKTGEREEEDFQIQAGVETKEVMAEETEEEDEDDKLRVLRPSRRSRSLSSHSLSLPRRRSANNHQDELESFSVSDSHDEATPPKQIFKFRWQKHTTRKPLVRKKENRKRPKKESLVAKPFPEWLVDLMFNIEEATTHQLVVE